MRYVETDRELGNKWRFTGNNFHAENGLDTSDMETFRKDPIASLAREVCQNSIDAKKENEQKVEVVFDSFKVKREIIPGIDRVEEEIKSCIVYQSAKGIEKNVETLNHMLKEIQKPEINCLRIGDYNTIGLTEIDKYSDGEGAFYKLTRTSGNSDKKSGKGGSKGIGKYASFVVSNFGTVFYSTKNINGQEGFLGISKLCSTIYDEETKERTEGTGYYGKNYQGEPVFGSQVNLKPEYKRIETGTDIYILGFNESKDWKADIIIKILDSFMAAIIKEELVVKVAEIELSKNNLEYIVANIDKYTNRAKEIKNIKAQYMLLTTVEPVPINMGLYGEAQLYIKAHNKDEVDMATYECTMIRYPYMKIKALKSIAHIPFSAVCIIGDNKLNENLRSIENPQHDSWDIHELDKNEIKQKEVKELYTNFIEKITEIIQEILQVSANTESDIEGAGAFLPSTSSDFGEKSNEDNIIVEDVATILKPKKNKIKETIVNQENEAGEGLTPNFIDREEDGEGAPLPTGENGGGGNSPHDGSGETGYQEGGEQEGMTLTPLSGVQYRMMGLDKNIGKYLIVFSTPESVKNCTLTFKIVDDNNNKERIDIKSALINGYPATIENGKVKKFDINSNEKYKIEITTGLNDFYCGEVGIEYESR